MSRAAEGVDMDCKLVFSPIICVYIKLTGTCNIKIGIWIT